MGRPSDESTLAELVQKFSAFCIFVKLTALLTAARQWSLYRVRRTQLRTSMFGISIFLDHLFYYCFFFRLFVTGFDRMEWDYATTCLVSRPLVPPPLANCSNTQISAGCQSVCRCEFYYLLILWKWLWFNNFVPFILPESICDFKQQTHMLRETNLFPRFCTFLETMRVLDWNYISIFVTSMFATLSLIKIN